MDGTWVTVDEAAHALGIDRDTVREWARSGSVTSFREGPTQRFVRLEEVREALYAIRGRPQGSLLQMISSHAAPADAAGRARISDLQGLIRERMHA
jgi:excisionase family DNA binding protein